MIVYLLDCCVAKMQIFVKTLTGKTITLEVVCCLIYVQQVMYIMGMLMGPEFPVYAKFGVLCVRLTHNPTPKPWDCTVSHISHAHNACWIKMQQPRWAPGGQEREAHTRRGGVAWRRHTGWSSDR